MKLKLTDNLFLKLISLGVAVLIWLVVMNINDAEKSRSFSKSVKLINTEVITENGKVFRVVEGTDYVNVRVRARKSIVDSLESEDFILTADMRKDLQLNDSMVGISVECKNKNINVAEDVTLSRRNVEVSIEDSATEQFQVHVRKQGDENEGLVVGSLIPEQTIIKITGPVSLVQRIKVVEAMVDVTGIPATTVRNCELRIYDSAGGEIDNTYLNYVGKTDGIAVTISLLNTKTVPLKFSYSGTPAENYVVKDISYKPETIEIAGTESVLASILRWEIPEEAVNVDGIDEELQLVVDLRDYLPSGIILKNEEESSALVIVEVEYVEPEMETEEEDGGDEGSRPSDSEVTKPSKPSDSEATKPSKPSDSEVTKPSKPSDGETVKPSKPSEGETAKPSKPSEGETTNPSVPSGGTGNDSSTDGVTGEQNNQNNEAGSGTSDKTESNS